MKLKQYKGLFLIVMLLVALGGCRTLRESVIHDELLVYDMPYDKTFMLVLDAVNKTPGWTMVNTDMQKGEVIAHTSSFSIEEQAKILVRRVERRQTSVELAPESQTTQGVGELLKSIDMVLSAEL